jgi:ribosome-associated protein
MREDFHERRDNGAAPSKTQVKAAMHALQELGERLVELAPSQFEKIELPDALRGAILEARGIRAHGGRRRQIQYIGKLMRTIDAEPIRAALDRLSGRSRRERARLEAVERWRARLLSDDGALTELLDGRGGIDVARLRTLIRNARREIARGEAPHAQREVFRMIDRALAAAAVTGGEKRAE